MAKKSSAKTAKKPTKAAAKAKSSRRATPPAKAARGAKTGSPAPAAKATGGRPAATAGKYQQSGAPWWKQFLPG